MNTFSRSELTQLEAKLRDDDQELFGQYEAVVRKTRDLMPRAYATFWSYTDHTLTHTHAVVEIIDRLCPSDVTQSLSPEELFVLLSGATLHDIGMITSRPLAGEGAEAARRGHDVVGAEMVRNDPTRFGVPPIYASAVAAVIRHHRSSNIAAEVRDIPVNRDMMRLRLLCSLVRAGDELHLTQDRAPDVVTETLSLPEESVRHFAACRAVTGIAPAAVGAPEILLSATVDDAVAEEGLHHIVAKVNQELEQLHTTFTTHGLPAYYLRAVLHRENLILKKTLLHLCLHPEGKRLTEIVHELNESESEVSDALRSLSSKSLIGQVVVASAGVSGGEEAATEPCFIVLTEDVETVQEIGRYFLHGVDDVRFTHSTCARRAVEQVVFPWLTKEYACSYSVAEASVRIAALQHSPSALAAALFSADVGRMPSLISRRPLLDLQIMNGVLSDIYRRPECFEGSNVKRIASDLGRHIARHVRPFVQLITHAWSNRDKSIEEMWNKVSAGSDGSEASSHGLTISLKHPAKPAFLSFPHLLAASLDEGVPLEITSPHLVGFQHFLRPPAETQGSTGQNDPRLPAIDSLSSLTIQPYEPTVPVTDLPPHQAPVDMVVDETTGTCTLLADVSRSFEDETTPWRAEIKMEEGKISGIHLLPSHLVDSCADQLESCKRQRLLATGGACRIEFLSRATGDVVFSGTHTLERPSESADEKQYLRAIEILSRTEKALGERISAPVVFSPETLDDILSHEAQLTSGTTEEIRATLRSIAERAAQDAEWLRVRITVIEATGNIVADYCPTVEVQIPTMSRPNAEGYPEDIDAVVRKGGMSAHYHSTRSPRELVEIFRAGMADGHFTAPGMDAMSPQQETSEALSLSQSKVDYVVSPMQKQLWGHEQLIHLTVRAATAERQTLDRASHAMRQKDYESAEETLVSMIVEYPTSGNAHTYLGWSYFEQQKQEKAIISLQNALRFLAVDDHDYINAASLLARSYALQGNADLAIRHYELVLSKLPAFRIQDEAAFLEQRMPDSLGPSMVAPRLLTTGWLFSKGGNVVEAAEHFKRFQALDDSVRNRFMGLADVLIIQPVAE